MALKAVPTIDIPALDQIHERVSAISLSSPSPRRALKFAVIGHRGNGMNTPSSALVRENSILSFNQAALFSIPFVEFDVQVTSDCVPIIFHDVFILTGDLDGVIECRTTDLTLSEFLSYGPARDPVQIIPRKNLLRRSADGKVFDWVVEADDPFCTLEEAFRRVDSRLGFNIELKFDDNLDYTEESLANTLQIIIRTVAANALGRPVFFSTFHPDAARIVRRLQGEYHVFFLTDGGTKIFSDSRRNSLEEAVKLCIENGLDGIVSEVRGVLRNPASVARIKDAKLRLLTYGGLNNTVEVVYMQHMMGIDGVIVDRVKDISEAVAGFQGQGMGEGLDGRGSMPNFSEAQLSYLRELIAELAKQ